MVLQTRPFPPNVNAFPELVSQDLKNYSTRICSFILNLGKFYIAGFGSSIKAQAVLRNGMIEAMACGLPPLVLETYELRNRIPSTFCITVQKNNPRVIATGIKKCINMDENEYLEISSQIRNFVIQNFCLNNAYHIQSQILYHKKEGSKKDWWKAFFLGLVPLYLYLLDIKRI